MARIELRDANITIKDGLSGTALINETTPTATDTDVDIDAVSINRPNTTKVPVGARFNVSTAGNITKYTVTARVLSLGVDESQTVTGTGATMGTIEITLTVRNPANSAELPKTVAFSADWDDDAATIQTGIDAAAIAAGISAYVAGDIAIGGGALNTSAITIDYTGTSVAKADHSVTAVGAGGYDGTESAATVTDGEFVDQVTNMTFSPAWGTPTPADDDTITFLPIEVAVKVGDGNLTYTENKEYEYELDRGNLDTVREGDQQPLDVTLDFVYEFVTTGTNEPITPVDALKGINGAAEFTSSAADPCEPYAVDIEVDADPGSCAGAIEREITLFPDFRYDSLEYDLDEATISSTGRCNVTDAVVTRVPPS